MEISPSAVLENLGPRSVPANLPGVRVGDGQIELYDHTRYFAVTGQILKSIEIEDHAADVRAL